MIASLQRRLRRLLDLCLDDKIEADTFDGEHRHLTAQIKTLQDEAEEFERDQKARDEAVDKFDLVNPPSLLADLDLERIWQAATPSEQRTLIDDLVDTVCIYADGITVQAAGAPPFIVGLDEVGLTQCCKPVVSEAVVSGRRQQSTGGSNLGLVETVSEMSSLYWALRSGIFRHGHFVTLVCFPQ